MKMSTKRQKGLSLIEMLVAMVIAGVIIAGTYRTFTVQQKTFVVQEQVSEVQQSVRSVMDLIARDIRATGFGRPPWVADSVTITSTAPADFTVRGAFGLPFAILQNDANIGDNQITLNQTVDLVVGTDLLIFESDTSNPPLAAPIYPLRYATVRVWADADNATTIDIDADGATAGTRELLDLKLRANSLVYTFQPVNYVLNGNRLERNGETLATNVTNFQITDNNDGSFQIMLTVQTRTEDPDFPGGFRARTLTSTIKGRNLNPSS